MSDPVPSYTITRVYTAEEWLASPVGTLAAFRDDIETEAAQHGHHIDDVTNVNITANYTDDDGEPAITQIRVEAIWYLDPSHVVASTPRSDLSS